MKKKSPLLIVFFTIFLDLLGFGLIIPYLTYFTKAYGGGDFQIGLLMAVYSLAQFLFNPIWGRLSDRIGRRPIIIMSLIGSSISHLMFALSGSLTGLFVARTLAGVFGANIAASQAAITDSTTPDNRAKGMGMVGAAFGLGMTFGPGFAALLTVLAGKMTGDTNHLGIFQHFNYQLPALGASMLCFLNVIFAIFALPETLKPESESWTERRGFNLDSFMKAVSHPGVLTMFLLYFCATFCLASMETTLGIFLKGKWQFTAQGFGAVLFASGILMAIVQGMLIGRASKKVGERKLITSGQLLMAIGLLTIPIAPNVFFLLASMGLLATGYGFSNPSISSLVSKSVDAAEVGGAIGIAQGFSSLARVLGPAFAGWASEYVNISSPYVSTGILIAVSCVISLSLFKLAIPGAQNVAGAAKSAHT